MLDIPVVDPSFSLFSTASRGGERVFVTYRPGLQALTEEVENAVLRGPIRTRVFVGFQKLSFFLPRATRYAELASKSDGVWILGLPDVVPPAIPGVTYVSLTEGHALVREWVVVVDAPGYFSAIVAEDLSGFAVPNRQRRFRGVWTFNDALVSELQQTLSRALGLSARAPSDATSRDFRSQLQQVERLVDTLIDALGRRIEVVQQLEQLRRDLTSLLVHDLRSPLTVLGGSLALLGSQADRMTPERLKRYLGGASRSAQVLNDMISGLLDIAALEEGKLVLTRVPLNAAQLLATAVDFAHPVAVRAGKSLILETSESVPLVLGDSEKLGRVLNNLVNNALKYTAANGRIVLSARRRDDCVEFTVSDDGPGIPPEALGRLFNKFEQVGGAGQRHGSGLGLYFCRLIVEAHGGSISVQSEPGKGTTFTFSLPTAPAPGALERSAPSRMAN